ncbi:hypothetical protein C7212DRAFT_278370 [Tuber magnatum]|uniref:Uncharacterized protein n=1 Tax=Tuber magnatum TaxID=42249 RepID=A0A317SRS4_9PEZI|nr:hypothetical protein C7212DRAFT_278370 [Tuber magnatum]
MPPSSIAVLSHFHLGPALSFPFPNKPVCLVTALSVLLHVMRFEIIHPRKSRSAFAARLRANRSIGINMLSRCL